MNPSRNTAPAPDAPAIETPEPDAALVAKAKGERLKHLAADVAHAITTGDTERVREIMKAMNGLTVEEVAPLAFITAASLRGKKIELPPLIIEGILRRREVMVFAGESKVGKTWLPLSLALAVASGTPWLGHPDGAKGEEGVCVRPAPTSHHQPHPRPGAPSRRARRALPLRRQARRRLPCEGSRHHAGQGPQIAKARGVRADG